ncbi:MAG: DUF3025 domain-containing protein [Zoogloeaceae bacterium]|nr:DUF3025 domain-containing protein [Zoogloeaceae bacterium]
MSVPALCPAPFTCPLYFPLAPLLHSLPPAPDAAALSALVAARPVFSAQGLPIRFASPVSDGMGYEARIAATGVVETRPDNWHDWFNALVWLSYPRAKAALSARHASELEQSEATAAVGRGHARDAMTHFDECGAVVVAEDDSLLELLRRFCWRELFVERRAEVIAGLRVFIFGHATYEALLSPFRGLTAKCVLVPVAPGWLEKSVGEQLGEIDGWLAADLAAGKHGDSRSLQPLPLLGLPGVVADSEDPAYYDDVWQFRPGRSRQLPSS